jgi:hypothetical protein
MALRDTRLLLNSKEIADEFFQDAHLLGVMASAKDYQLCWQLNSWMGLNFRRNNDIEIQLTKKKRNYFFSVYEFCEPTSSLYHYIYNNHFDGEYLLPEFKHLDFLWLMKGDEVKEDYLRQIIQSVRTLNGIQLVLELTNQKIRNKEHLVF